MIQLRITTHSGEDDLIEVDQYNATDLTEKLNNPDVHSINIGDNIYSRIDIKNVMKV